MFILACIFVIVGHFGGGWSVLFAMGGAVLGVIFPSKVEPLLTKVFRFIFKQDKTIQLVLGAVALLFIDFPAISHLLSRRSYRRTHDAYYGDGFIEALIVSSRYLM
jgi:hypothetical protein